MAELCRRGLNVEVGPAESWSLDANQEHASLGGRQASLVILVIACAVQSVGVEHRESRSCVRS